MTRKARFVALALLLLALSPLASLPAASAASYQAIRIASTSTASIGGVAGCGDAANGTSLSWAHSFSGGANSTIIVAVAYLSIPPDYGAPANMTWSLNPGDDASFSKISIVATLSDSYTLEVWYWAKTALVNGNTVYVPPNGGAGTLKVSLDGAAAGVQAVAYSVAGLNFLGVFGAPFVTFDASQYTGNSTSMSLTTSGASTPSDMGFDWAVMAAYDGMSNPPPPTPGAGQTLRASRNDGYARANRCFVFASSTRPVAPDGSINTTWGDSANGEWAGVLWDLAPAPAVIMGPPSPTTSPLSSGFAVSGCSAVTVTDVRPEAANAVLYIWDFGDGSPEQVTANGTVTHAYASPGTYILNVTVQDKSGAIAAFSGTVSVGGALCLVSAWASQYLLDAIAVVALAAVAAYVLLRKRLGPRFRKWTLGIIAVAAVLLLAAWLLFGGLPFTR